MVAVLVLLSSVEAQRRRNTTLPSTTTTSELTTIADVTKPAPESSTAPSTILKFVDALRQALERRRSERQQRIEERRANALKDLGNLSDRQREYELQRAERKQTLEEERVARRREMDARRAGRLPSRELDRVNRLRQLRLLAEAVTNEVSPDENEVDGSIKSGDVVRRIVLIEEANGNVRLVDLDSDEGRKLLSRVMAAEESSGVEVAAAVMPADDQQEAANKLKLKLGQL